MSDYDTIRKILEKAYPSPATRPYIEYVQGKNIILEFSQADEWYNTYFIFDSNGTLVRVD